MGIRKFKADYLFSGYQFLPEDTVVVTDDYGVIKDLIKDKEAGEDVEHFHGLLTPGFVNTHCHIELSHMKGLIPQGTGLIEFLTRVIRERNFSKEAIHAAIEEAEKEMYDAGVVAVGDICNTTDSIQIKQGSRISWLNFLEVIGFNGKDAEARISYATTLLADFAKATTVNDEYNPHFYNTTISPHAPYSVSHALFSLINEVSAGQIITIHNQEAEAENQFYQNKTGELFDLYKNLGIDPTSFEATNKTTLRTYLPWLSKAGSIVLVHNAFTGEDDILFANSQTSTNIYFCICINANRYIQSLNPPINLFRKHGCTITLGTDSYASNTQLSILEEMKTIHFQFPGIALEELLQWATINGALALGMDSKLGSFEIGKQPGVVLIDNIQEGHLTAKSSAQRLV